MNEGSPSAPEVPSLPSAPGADHPPSSPAGPPAASLVVNGVVQSERERQLEARAAELEGRAAAAEARARKAEFDAAERERLAQELLNQTRAKPDERPIPPKVKRFGTLPILRTEGEQ
jgi:hypothetical protein